MQPQPNSMQMSQSFQLSVTDSASMQHDSQLYQQSRLHPMMEPQGNGVPFSASFRTASPLRGHEEAQVGPFSSSFHAGTGTLGALGPCGLQSAPSSLGQTWGNGGFLGMLGGKGLARPFSFDLGGMAARMWGSHDAQAIQSEFRMPEAEVSLETGAVALKDPHGFGFMPGHRFNFRAGDRSRRQQMEPGEVWDRSRRQQVEPAEVWEPPPLQRDEPPPPPRVAPAARSSQSFVVSPTIEERPERSLEPSLELPRSGPLHASLPPSGTLRASSCYTLQVQMSDSRWETLEFNSSDDLNSMGERFVRKHGLNAMIQPGLVAKMQQMAAGDQLHETVDIVDLI